MANVTALCTSFKADLLNGYHAFNGTYRTADTFKGALYLQTGSLGAATTTYSTTNEVQTAGGTTGYTAGGNTLTSWATISTSGGSGTTAYTTPANLVWTSLVVTAYFDGLLIYNSTQANKAVATFYLGAEYTVNGTFTVTMPGNAYNTALIQLA